MTHGFFALLQTDPMSTPEVIKYVFFAIITAAVTYIATSIPAMRRQLDKLTHVLMGPEGTNGLRSDVQSHNTRLDELENWKRDMDAVSRTEEKMMRERGIPPRRLRDRVMRDDPLGDPDE